MVGVALQRRNCCACDSERALWAIGTLGAPVILWSFARGLRVGVSDCRSCASAAWGRCGNCFLRLGDSWIGRCAERDLAGNYRDWSILGKCVKFADGRGWSSRG